MSPQKDTVSYRQSKVECYNFNGKSEPEEYKCEGSEEPCQRSHSYYQWVPFLFIFQGLLFSLPNQMWKYVESGKMSSISTAVTTSNKSVTVIIRVGPF